MFASSIDIARVLLGCLAAVFAVNFVSNLVLTYFGYDPKRFAKRCILRKRWSLGFVVLFWLLFVCTNTYVEKSTDYDPLPISMDKLVGTWQKRGVQFRLDANGTVARVGKFADAASTVYWTLDTPKHLLHVRGETGDLLERWRVITIRGEYRLIEDYPVSLDATNLSSGFTRIEGSD